MKGLGLVGGCNGANCQETDGGVPFEPYTRELLCHLKHTHAHTHIHTRTHIHIHIHTHTLASLSFMHDQTHSRISYGYPTESVFVLLSAMLYVLSD